MTGRSQNMNSVLNWIIETFDEFGGILVIDREGYILHVGSRFAEFHLGSNPDEAVGKKLENYVPDSELFEVMKTGIPRIGKAWNRNGQTLVVSRLPIFQDGKIVGAIGVTIFRRLEEALDFAHRIIGVDGQLDFYKEEVKRLWGAKYSFDSIFGSSLAIVEAKRKAWDIATTHLPVLLTGATGTGKELFAHAIHLDSPKKDGPFVAVNCAGIPDNLVESELFGYEAGAFTGARKGGKPGKFELANGGTLFLDEVSELPLHMQAKLLRVLQESEIERVGGTSVIPIKVRIISATNVDLEDQVAKGKFREDLYYRLNVFSVRIPSLQERTEDISSLSYYFIMKFNQEVGTKVTGLSDEAQRLLISYEWPGNVRELKNTIERACLDAKMGLIKPDNLYYITDKLGYKKEIKSIGPLTLKEASMQAEKELILKALETTHGNKKQACELLNINRTSFYNKLKELGIALE